MIRHSLLHFIRNLRRQKLFSIVNLLGLTVSIACALLIYLYVRHEFSYDRFHNHADRIYRINQTFIWGDNNDHQFASTGPGVAYAVNAEVPEAELITSLHTPGTYIVSYRLPSQEVISFEEDEVLAADTNFFDMFNFPLLAGDASSAMEHANTLVMTESTARKYFGAENPVGKLLQLGGIGGKEHTTFEVTGVVQDPPDNSYIRFDILLSMKSFRVDRLYWSWIWTQLETYVRFRENTDMETVQRRLQTIPRQYAEQTLREVMNTSFDEYIQSGKKWELFLQPLTRIHLPEATVLNRINDSGDIKTVYSLAGAAVVIVLLACINFMNLSTAQFTRRIREASLRKILGLSKTELSLGYFLEALVFCMAALVTALAITQGLLPVFNTITRKSLELDLFNDPSLALSLGALILLMALASSSYPAWFLGNFNPATGIKGKIKMGREGHTFRNGLVVFQFSVSIFLMISTVIVFQQLDFVSAKHPGFNKENLLVLKHVEALGSGTALANETRQIPGIEGASLCTSLPPKIYGGDKFSAEGLNESFPLNFTSADANYIPALGIELLYGRNFSVEIPADSHRVIINETAVHKIGWPLDESVIGRKLKYPNSDDVTFEVIGVVADFNYWTLQSPIEPMGIFRIDNRLVHAGNRQFLALRLPSGREGWEATLEELRGAWTKHAGDLPFEYFFVDQDFDETFQTQQQLGKILTVLAVLALLIAGLGLLGMILYSLEHRIKEIGIRKISGASVGNIIFLTTRAYAKLILLAFVVAAPLAYWLMRNWLDDFAYRITPSIGTFLVIGACTWTLGFLITGYHSFRAARMNPVDVLRDD